MSTSLALQLSQIATQSTHSFNLRAQKAAHSQSLIFERQSAAVQDFGTLYVLCLEGFEELCLLDRRFVRFRTTIFSTDSKNKERTQMTAEENEELDRVLEDFLSLVGAKLLLKPAVKAMEWLVRRFRFAGASLKHFRFKRLTANDGRVHEHNTSCLLLTFLPYHNTPIFQALLAILPPRIPDAFRFLRPYIASLANLPRHVIVYSMVNNHAFSAALNEYVLSVCRLRQEHQALLIFWAGAIAEAVSGILELARSGRKGVQSQNEQDVLLRLLPTLNEGLAFKEIPELRLGCYMVLSILATKADLSDTVLTTMMEAVVAGWTEETAYDGLVCLSLLAENKQSTSLSKPLLQRIMRINNLMSGLKNLSYTYSMANLTLSLISGTIEEFGTTGITERISFVEEILNTSILNDTQARSVFKSLLSIVHPLNKGTVKSAGNDPERRAKIADLLGRLYVTTALAGSMTDALKESNVDIASLGLELQASLQGRKMPIKPSTEEIELPETVPPVISTDSFEDAFSHLPTRTVDEVSFLSDKASHIFDRLVQAFLAALPSPAAVEKFSNIPLLRPETAIQDPLFYSFFIRVWCGPYPGPARSTALQVVGRSLTHHGSSVADIQALIPYLIIALADTSRIVRQAVAEVFLACTNLYHSTRDAREKPKAIQTWGADGLYRHSMEHEEISWMKLEDIRRIVTGLLLPALEECILDSTRIPNLVLAALVDSSEDKSTTIPAEAKLLKSKQRAAFLSFLASHAIRTPLLSVKLSLLRTLNQVNKAGTTSRTEKLLPLLEHWISLESAVLLKRCDEEHVSLQDLDEHVVGVIDSRNKAGLAVLQSIVDGELGADRPDIVAAALRHLRKLWTTLRSDAKSSFGQSLFRLSFNRSQGGPQKTAHVDEARDLLQKLELSPKVLATFLEQLAAAHHPQATSVSVKRRRTAHDQMVQVTSQTLDRGAAVLKEYVFVLELVDNVKPGAHPVLMKGLFDALSELQQLKAQVGAKLAYPQSLILGSLLVMVDSLKVMNHPISKMLLLTFFLADCSSQGGCCCDEYRSDSRLHSVSIQPTGSKCGTAFGS